MKAVQHFSVNSLLDINTIRDVEDDSINLHYFRLMYTNINQMNVNYQAIRSTTTLTNTVL